MQSAAKRPVLIGLFQSSSNYNAVSLKQGLWWEGALSLPVSIHMQAILRPALTLHCVLHLLWEELCMGVGSETFSNGRGKSVRAGV